MLSCFSRWLGEEVGARYTRDQMSALLKHTQTTDIEDREKLIMTGVLSLKAKKIRDVMTNLIDVFMLEANRIVDDELVLNIHGYGYSRIPVYDGRRLVFFFYWIGMRRHMRFDLFLEIILWVWSIFEILLCWTRNQANLQ